jgi:hypothetical protein
VENKVGKGKMLVKKIKDFKRVLAMVHNTELLGFWTFSIIQCSWE